MLFRSHKMRQVFGLSLLSAVLGAYSPFPVPIPTTGQAALPRAPLGFSFLNINGGGYAVGSGTSPTIGWLSETGEWTANVWTDTDVSFAAYSTIWAVKWEQDLGNTNDYGVLLVTRVNLATGMSALSVVNPFDWSTQWSVVLGPGFAFDVDSTSGGSVYVTDGIGGLWYFSYSYSAAPSTIYYGNNTILEPTTLGSFGFGASGIISLGSSAALLSIAEPGPYKPRFYCVDASSSDTSLWTYTPITLAAGASLDALNYNGAWGLVDYTYGDNDVVGFISAPRGFGTITIGAGQSWCASGATYTLGIWNATGPTADPTASGNLFAAQTYNCDLNITVALGTQFNGLPTYPVTAPAMPYALYVAYGNLPFTAANGFVTGNDCHNAIPVPASAVVPGVVYDMACYLNGRVQNPYQSAAGYGIWFFVNTTGLTGTYSFTTRTAATNFDNYQLFFDQCPTACDDYPSGYTTYITSDDDSGSGPSDGSQPDCGDGGLCSEYQFDFATTPRAGVYVLLSFYSSSVPYNGELHVSSFQVVPLGTTPSNILPFPSQVCDPRITVPPPPAPPATSAPANSGDSNSADSFALF